MNFFSVFYNFFFSFSSLSSSSLFLFFSFIFFIIFFSFFFSRKWYIKGLFLFSGVLNYIFIFLPNRAKTIVCMREMRHEAPKGLWLSYLSRLIKFWLHCGKKFCMQVSRRLCLCAEVERYTTSVCIFCCYIVPSFGSGMEIR